MKQALILAGIFLFLGVQGIQGQIYTEEQPPEGKQGVSMSGGIGAVTLDGHLYNSITLRPEFSIGKFGIGLDLPLYFDANGNFRTDEWDQPNDILDKFYYVRYGLPNDNFYLRAGALSSVTLGYGLIVNNYTNTIDYPSIRRVGGRFHIKSGPFGAEGFVANIKEMSGPGLVGARLTYDGFGPFVVGATAVADVNPYLGLQDQDGDGYPDKVDDFPKDKNAAVDSDGDGIPDKLDLDRDGDGWADNPGVDSRLGDIQNQLHYSLDPNGAQTKPEPFNIKRADAPSVTEVGLDIGLPLPFLNTQYTKLFLYAQSAMLLNEKNAVAAVDTNGWGIGAPGISFDTRFPFNVKMNLTFEYRIFSRYFVGEFFDRAYDIQRVSFQQVRTPAGTDTLEVMTKAARLLPQMTDRLKGYYGSLTFNLFDYLQIRSVYQDYRGRYQDRSFYADAGLNTSVIPKISSAYAYYRKAHIRGANLFKLKDESTIIGYRLGYQIGGNVQLIFGYRETYLDRNGDGKIDAPNETIRTTSVETAFSF